MTTTKIWECKIGEVNSVARGADYPMRQAVADAYKAITGVEPVFIFSGWGASLTEAERAVVENRLPAPATAPDRHAQELLAQEITLQNMRERHAQELCAYQITVDKLRAERNPMTDKEIAGAIVRSPDPMAFGKLPAEGWRPMVRLVEAHHGIGDKT
jgi:hypothetical protein